MAETVAPKRATRGEEPLPQTLIELEREISKLEKIVTGIEKKTVSEKWKQYAALTRAHQCLVKHPGQFKAFVEEGCGLSLAYGYQAVKFIDCWGPQVQEELAKHLSMTALLRLSNSGCEAAISEAKQLAEKGIRVSCSAVEELIEKHAGNPKRPNADWTRKVTVPGVATLVLHRLKTADATDLHELLQAIEELAKKFSPSEQEAAA